VVQREYKLGFLRYKTLRKGVVSKSKMKQICVYIDPAELTTLRKARGKRGLATDSAYFRVLYFEDTNNKKKNKET
jgi:hypothetical protein